MPTPRKYGQTPLIENYVHELLNTNWLLPQFPHIKNINNCHFLFANPQAYQEKAHQKLSKIRISLRVAGKKVKVALDAIRRELVSDMEGLKL